MFDEASDIQMTKHLNMFVNVLLETGEVKTLTLAFEVLFLNQSWHKVFAHCVQQIDCRFPPETMYIFKLMQVLDPCVVHGSLRRELIGTETLGVDVEQLLHIFEIPLAAYVGSGLSSV